MKIVKTFDLEAVFALSEILDKMEISLDKELFNKTVKTDKLESVEDATQLGKEIMISAIADLGIKVVSKIHKAKKEVLSFVADMSGTSVEEVKKLSLKELKEFFGELFATEGLKSFLSQAAADKTE